jgi:hypothetical protein
VGLGVAPPYARRWVGRSLLAIGTWHAAFGLWWFAVPLRGALRAGWWNAVGWTASGPALAFWFLVAGALTLLVGALVDAAEAEGRPTRLSTGWALVALALLGGAAVPVSGFWLLLAPGLGVVRAHARRARRTRDVEPGFVHDRR